MTRSNSLVTGNPFNIIGHEGLFVSFVSDGSNGVAVKLYSSWSEEYERRSDITTVTHHYVKSTICSKRGS